MPFVLTVLALAVVLSYLRGGRLRHLADAPLRWPGLLLVGVTLQHAGALPGVRDLLPYGGTSGPAVLFSHLLVVVWVAVNRHLPGVGLVLIGLSLNALAIGVNGAMPVDPAAIRALGFDPSVLDAGTHVVMDASTRLPFLADVWALPVLRSVVSVGDVVLAAGLIRLMHALMTADLAAEGGGEEPMTGTGLAGQAPGSE